MANLESLAAELAITIGDSDVWIAIGVALFCGALTLAFGTAIARGVGLLAPGAPLGEILGVGLASGLIVAAAWWAAIRSGGQSSFTPGAIGLAIAVALAAARRFRSGPPSLLARWRFRGSMDTGAERDPSRPTSFLKASALSGSFIAGVALLYGATMVPSARQGLQPVEFSDEAFYSVLGRDLGLTGVETVLSPSGFSDLSGFPEQTWYHWGELWLASGVIALFGTDALAARHFVVLPVLLLACAALTGTLVRLFGRTSSRGAYVFGALACLFLAPVQPIPIPIFSGSNVGLIFGITTYGLAAAAVLMAMYGLAVMATRRPTWELAWFMGSTVALILPSHIAMALLAATGVGAVIGMRVVRAIRGERRLSDMPALARRTVVAVAIVGVATVIFGSATGHGQASGGPTLVSPFNVSWLTYVGVTALGGGAFFAIVIAWVLTRHDPGVEADLYLGTAAIVVAGAIAWGLRFGHFTMFHVFFGAIAVFATPVAAIAIRTVWARLRLKGHHGWAVALVALTVIQLEFGVVGSVLRLQSFGPSGQQATPIAILEAIRGLPAGSKLAYACGRFEERAFTTPRLLSIDAHTGQRVVPLCFAAEVFSTMIGAEPDPEQASLYFEGSPQRALFSDAGANPAATEVASFLKSHGIDYLYVDREHPNTLVPDAVPIASSGDARVLRIP